MDTLLATRTMPPQSGLNFAELVAMRRRPLPTHAIEGGNFRRWATAVCHAEVKHREADYARVERELGVHQDQWDFPNCVEVGQFDHERHAGKALLWLSHLQTHESEKRTPFHFLPFCDWRAKDRAAWIAKRRILWAGFIKEVRAYQAAKGEGL
tara:strand:- start:350 stop:808 length:459 start_codon:yes stop_codon:yes gene_type:complete